MAELTGIREATDNLNQLLNQIKGYTGKELKKIGLDLQGKAQRRAPVDTGDLRGSATTELISHRGGHTVEVGFNKVYALVQHEGLHFEHPRGGKAKYLEGPLLENTQKYFEFLKQSVEEATK